uniref:Protein tyrosine phosphatase receptor type C associated protein n=1 Tax=Naja naja TaxID=35670 RepID=A0A8C7E431_NAJNA
LLQKLRLSHVLLLLLPGKIQAENPESGRRNNEDAQVTILICLLFVLLLMLCIAWYYLNHITEGRYHPRHLMSNLVLWWQQFWRETLAEDLDEDYQEEEQNDGELEEERQQHEEEKLTKEANEEAALEEALEEDEVSKVAQGSAEVLLSHLHSFSGTASWEDSGKSLSVTAL